MSYFLFSTISLFLMILIEYKIPYIYSLQTVPIIHAIITSTASNYVFFKNPMMILEIYKYNESDFDKILLYVPFLTFNYSLFDLYYGIISNNKSFIIHGTVLILGSIFFILNGNLHYTYPALLLETSTIFLNMLSLPYPIIKILFGITFLIYRNLFFPIFSTLYIYNNFKTICFIYEYQEKCITFFLFSVNALNFYWGEKIVRKIKNQLKLKFV